MEETKPLKIALIVCDVPCDAVVCKYGAYPKIFGTFFNLNEKAKIQIVAFNAQEGEFPSLAQLENKEFIGIALTGSKFGAYENKEWILDLKLFIRSILNINLKVIGICFGHQLVIEALGGKVMASEQGWEIGYSKISLNDEGQRIFQKRSLAINQMHKDIVTALPDGFRTIAWNSVCAVQGTVGCQGKSTFLTFQGHPEMTPEIINIVIKSRIERGLFFAKSDTLTTQNTFEAFTCINNLPQKLNIELILERSTTLPLDDKLIATSFINFLLDTRL